MNKKLGLPNFDQNSEKARQYLEKNELGICSNQKYSPRDASNVVYHIAMYSYLLSIESDKKEEILQNLDISFERHYKDEQLINLVKNAIKFME